MRDFGIDQPADRRHALDVGASTGGFTDGCCAGAL
jgi:predicted rRNA methylase YqxC with S4 and FtsJ domains